MSNGDTNGDVLAIRDHVDNVLSRRGPEILEGVSTCIANALGVDRTMIQPAATLTKELAAESLDYLDMTFRLESAFGVKIPRGALIEAVRAGLDGSMDVRGKLTAEALVRLRILMPEIEQTAMKDGLMTHAVGDLFTVMTFARLVAWRLP